MLDQRLIKRDGVCLAVVRLHGGLLAWRVYFDYDEFESAGLVSYPAQGARN
jgi:hypothetical protein